QNLLNNLKAEVTKLGQTKGNSSLVKTYKVKWAAGKGITEKSKSHSAYLTKFCHDFVTDFKTAISQAVSNSGKQEEKAAEKSDLLFDEVIHHAAFAQTKLKSFCGRSQLIETILSKLDGDTSSQPVVAFGESGRGKTALMAKLVDSRRNMSSNESLVYRFLGTSPHSSNIHSVLQSITLQICELIPTPPPLYHELQNFTSLVMKFNEVLDTASAVISRGDTQTHLGEKLIIFLDSLDQLSELDGAHRFLCNNRLNWLPKHLPPHVHIILSTLPDLNLGILDTLHRTLPSSNFTEVTDLDRETGCEILNTWLKDSGRTLSQPQHDFVMDAFVKSPQPLYLKLAFDEARLWKSYTDVSSLYLGKSAKEAISLFFKRLENTHGELFVARSIGYLVASRNGLGEAELNDLLSLDNEVLDCSYRHWSPPSHNVVRIPTLLWTRLRNDLGADIVERQSTGYTVLALYHRQFIEVARQRYLGSDVKEKVHQNIAEYFLGKWSDGKKKSLKLNIWKNKEMKANRNVATQPLKFTAKIFNFRKLDELPFQLLSAGMWQELNDVVVSSADWLTHKIEAFSIKEMLQDYDMILSKKPDTEITLIRNALKLAKPTLEFPGKVTNHVCSEIIGRLAYFTKDFPRLVGKLVTESEQLLKRMNKMCLIPLCGSFPPPGGPLRTTLTGFSKSVTCMEVSCDASALFAGSRDGTIMIWELGVDEVLHTIHLHKDTVLCFATAAPGLRLASSSADNTLQVLNWDTGSIVASMVEDHTEHTYHCNLALNDDGTVLVSACGKQINIWDVSSSSIQHSIKESNYLSCNILLCGQAVIAGYKNGAIMSWSLETGNTMYDTTTANFLIQDKLMSLFNNGKVDLYNSSSGVLISSYDVDTNVEMSACAGGYVAFSCEKEIHVWKIEGQELKIFNKYYFKQKTSVLQHHHDSVSTLNFNKTGDILVSGGRDHTLLCWTIGKDGITLADNMSGMGAPVDHVVLSGNIVASSSKNERSIKVWN
uniref:Uncharacterized protein n=1 Tax=Ciona intestinalis TaxID=7719 RepID=H2Y0Z1_CIOIN